MNKRIVGSRTEKGQHCASLISPESLYLDGTTQEVLRFSNILPTKSSSQTEKDTVMSNRGRSYGKIQYHKFGERHPPRPPSYGAGPEGKQHVTVYDTCTLFQFRGN